MAWLSSGRITNPTANQVLLDTLAVVGGSYFFRVQGSSTVASAWEVQWQDATNVTTLKSFIIAVGSMGTSESFEVPQNLTITMNPNERIRVIQVGAVTGSVSVSLVGNL